jgi:hypothetical protein
MIERPIEVRVDELLLAGFPSADRERIGTAVQHEVERLVSARQEPWPEAAGDLAVLSAGSFRIEPGMSPEAIGAEIGQAVYRRLGG